MGKTRGPYCEEYPVGPVGNGWFEVSYDYDMKVRVEDEVEEIKW